MKKKRIKVTDILRKFGCIGKRLGREATRHFTERQSGCVKVRAWESWVLETLKELE